jgi:cell division protein ZapA
LNLAHDLQQMRDELATRDRELERTLNTLHRRLDDLFDVPAR